MILEPQSPVQRKFQTSFQSNKQVQHRGLVSSEPKDKIRGPANFIEERQSSTLRLQTRCATSVESRSIARSRNIAIRVSEMPTSYILGFSDTHQNQTSAEVVEGSCRCISADWQLRGNHPIARKRCYAKRAR